MKRASVVIVDPSRLFRDGLKEVLRRASLYVAAEAQSLGDSLALLPDGLDIVLFSLDCSPAGASEADLASLRRLHAQSPSTRLVALIDEVSRNGVARALACGVDAFLSKNISAQVLVRSLELVMLGQQFFPPELAKLLAVCGLADTDLLPSGDIAARLPAAEPAAPERIVHRRPAPERALPVIAAQDRAIAVFADRDTSLQDTIDQDLIDQDTIVQDMIVQDTGVSYTLDAADQPDLASCVMLPDDARVLVADAARVVIASHEHDQPAPAMLHRRPVLEPPLSRFGAPPIDRSGDKEVSLSEREAQILQYLIGGSSNKAIARELTISEATVKVHVKGLLRKVRVTNRTQAAIWALSYYDRPSRTA